MRRSLHAAALAGLWSLTGCLPSAAPLPPVRFFDPSPPPVGEAGTPPRVTAAAHLGREIVVRVAAREVVFDREHQWIAEPRDLVAAVLARASGPEAAVVQHAALEAFELDLTEAPRAHVRIVLTDARGLVRVVDEWAPANDRSPAAAADAMAAALARVVERVRDR